MSAPYQAFKCADGYVTIGAANDRNFAKLARVLGHPEWITDPRFAADHQRVAHREELAATDRGGHGEAAARVLARRARQGRHPVRADPQLRGSADTPQALARDMTVEVDHPTLGPLRTLGTPIKMSATPLDPRRRGADARRAHRRRAGGSRL